MENQNIAGHDDTRPALMDLQLFAEEGGAGDAAVGDSVEGAVAAVGGDPASDDSVGRTGDDAATGEGTTDDKGTADEADKDAAKPDVPEKYDLTVPEGYTVDDNLMAEFTGVAHELGLNNEQANKLAGMHTVFSVPIRD